MTKRERAQSSEPAVAVRGAGAPASDGVGGLRGGEAPRVKHDCRVAFAETLLALAEQDSRVVAVCNDSVGSSNLKKFRERFPDRLINVGIAEQNLVGVSAGLAA